MAAYHELGERLGITASAARMHARRRHWQRRAPNAIGGLAHVLVPVEVDVHHVQRQCSARTMHRCQRKRTG